MASHPSDNQFEYGTDQGLSTTDDYIMFVHGWRMKTWERRAFAETAFKRLYHQGYKGKFGFFSWPTEWIDYDSSLWTKGKNAVVDPQHYDRCEVQARKSGTPLYDTLLKLRTKYGANHIHLFAHSMGNTVTSEALRLHSGSILFQDYVPCQSAEAAHAYDPDRNRVPDYHPGSFYGIPIDNFSYTVDKISFDTRNPHLETDTGPYYHQGMRNKIGKMINFFAPGGDPALASIWVVNQRMKPDEGWWPYDDGYPYREDQASIQINDDYYLAKWDRYFRDPAGGTDSGLMDELHWPEDRFEILAHIITARSRPTGTQAGMLGENSGEFDLSTIGIGNGKYDHSAEFQSLIMKSRSFYLQLGKTFKVLPEDAQ